MKKMLLSICLLLACGVVQAAKVEVSWLNPTQNTDGSQLTDLAQIRLEWGSCSGSAFGAVQAGLTVSTTQPGAALKAFVYPTGLAKVCIRAYAINTAGISSEPSGTVSKTLLPTTGKPVTLGQPVVLP